MMDEKKPPQGADDAADVPAVGKAATGHLLNDLGGPVELLWRAVRSARAAGQPELMAELETLANAYEVLIARVQPSLLFKPQ